MPAPVNPANSVAKARLLELLSPEVQWQRSLWTVGFCLGITELLEAASMMKQGTLSEASVRRIVSSCKRAVGQELGLRTEERQVLQENLKDIPAPDGVAFHSLKELHDRISSRYLLRLAEALRSDSFDRPERAARAIASYLLDCGYSETYLHEWFKEKIQLSGEQFSIADLCEEAHSALVQNGDQSFNVLVAFGRVPRSASGYPSGWLKGNDVANWLRGNGFSTAGIRVAGGLELPVAARDPIAAAEKAAALVDGFVARSIIGCGEPLDPKSTVWVKGYSTPLPRQTKYRGVRVKALYREDQIFSTSSTSNVDAAIELLAHLENHSPSAAIAGGWAAIEALLGERNDRSSAAENLAYLAACSIPRAELTDLSYKVERSSSETSAGLGRHQSNRERANVLAGRLATNNSLGLQHPCDLAAIHRLQQICRTPNIGLIGLQRSMADAFHRLYRQRNMVLHSGIATSVGMAATLRTVSKLAGAGIDRVAHAYYVQDISPLELTGKAKVAVALIQPNDWDGFISLLEP